MSDLKRKTSSALAWSFFDALGARLIQFAIGVVLARLLAPEQFGLIGMLTLFLMVSQTLVDCGFGSALIQGQDVSKLDTSTVFYLNISIGAVSTVLLWLAAPLVAAFFGEAVLDPLLRMLSFLLIINSFGTVQSALMTKAINFRTHTKITISAGFSSGTIGIGLAVLGYGVWSLAIQQLTNALIRVVLLWSFNEWRPTFAFSFESLRRLFGFGSKLLASSLLNTVFENGYFVIIGRMFSAVDLGYYTRASNLQSLPSSTLANIIGRVAFPVFSSIQNDQSRLKRGLTKALRMAALLNFPMMIGLAVVAEPLVIVLLTENWLPCVPFLQLLCMAGLLFPIHVINLNVLNALGRSDLFLRLEIIKKSLTATNLAISWQWGISAMIIGQVFISVLSFFLNGRYNKVLVGYRVLEQVRELLPYFLAAALMGLLVVTLGLALSLGPMSMLLCQVLLGVLVYLAICRGFGLSAYLDLESAATARLLETLRIRNRTQF